MRFCGTCGNELAPGQRFCGVCGSPTQIAPLPAPIADHHATAPLQTLAGPQVPPTYASPPRPPRRFGRTPILLAGAAVLAVIAVVTTLAVRGAGGTGEVIGYNGLSAPLVEPVEDRPEKGWQWEPPEGGSPMSVIGLEDRTLVSWYAEDGAEVTALDDDGQEIWTEEFDYTGYLSADVPGHEDIAFSAVEEGGGTTAFSTETGEELWDLEGYIAGTTKAGVLSNDFEGGIALLEPQTGDEIWSSDADTFSVAGDAVYLVQDDELTKVELGSGEEIWTVDSDTDAGEGSLSVAAGSNAVLITDGDDITAFSAGNGEELWSEGLGGPVSSIGHFFDDVFWVYSYSDAELTESSVVFYDAEGDEVEEVRVSPDEYFYANVITSGGEDYLLDAGTGTLFDSALEKLETFDGALWPVEGGVYAFDDRELSFTRFGSDQEEWSLDLGGGNARFEPGAGSVFRITGSKLTRYE